MSEKPVESDKKIVVIGMDGLDPNLMERWMDEGALPNFSKLRKDGAYSRLATVNPPQSPIVWTSFATGSNPGKHGVFDFIKRDAKNYRLSLYAEANKPSRKNTAFWQVTSRHKEPTFINFCPNTFPPDEVYGKMISGMGVPDIRGTQGTFSFYTTKQEPKKKDVGGIVINVRPEGNVINTKLTGPGVATFKGRRDAAVPLKIELLSGAIKISLQENNFELKEKSWSGWCRVVFDLGTFKKAHGICKFYLKSITPDFELYCTAINFDPDKPLFPISYPEEYAAEIAGEIGLYYTQGMPMDTWAMNEGRIDEEIFLEQAGEILKEKEDTLFIELSKFKSGVFFYYFESPDIIQHMFWRFIDKDHPLYDAKAAATYGDVIKKEYQQMDRILGRLLNTLDNQTILFVLSDHGFNTFRRQVHLNRWLRENGYLYLIDDSAVEGQELLLDIDWARTRAYAIGFSGIYLNLQGREKDGIVKPGEEAQDLKKEIAEKLKKLKDRVKDEDKTVIKDAYLREDVLSGPYLNNAPDIFVGFYAGYRASWQTALGGTPKVIIEDNLKKWSGDHLFDPEVVAGILLINRKVELRGPKITDLAPTILKEMGLEKNEDMDGIALY